MRKQPPIACNIMILVIIYTSILELWPVCVLSRDAVWRTGDVVNGPDLTGECDDVGGVSDELKRGGPVQPGSDYGERAVRIDPHK